MLNNLTPKEQKTLKALELLILNVDLLMDKEIVEILDAMHNELKRRNEVPKSIGGIPISQVPFPNNGR